MRAHPRKHSDRLMSIAELKTRLHDVPGIETLTMQMLAWRQSYSLGGRLISGDAAASDNDVKRRSARLSHHPQSRRCPRACWSDAAC